MTEETVEQSENGYSLDALVEDGALNENNLKDMAQKVRRTMRARKHFSRQDRPYKRSQIFASKSLDQLKSVSAFSKGLEEDDWTDFANAGKTVADCIKPFLSFYRSHGKLPEITLEEALAFVLYHGVVQGEIQLQSDLQLSSDTPRGSYS